MDMCSGFCGSIVFSGECSVVLDNLSGAVVLSFKTLVLNVIVKFLVSVVECAGERAKGLGVVGSVYGVCISVVEKAPSMLRLVVVCCVVFGADSVGSVVVNVLTFNVGSNTCYSSVLEDKFSDMSSNRLSTKLTLKLAFGRALEAVVVPRTMEVTLPSLNGSFVALMGSATVTKCVKVVSLAGTSSAVTSEACSCFFPLVLVTVVCLVVAKLLDGLVGSLSEGLSGW